MAATSGESNTLTPFGRPMLKHFLFDPDYKNLNHGSFGTYPSAVQVQQRKFQEEEEGKPDVFIRYRQPAYLSESRKAVAKLLNIPLNETVFVKNASTGVNTVLRNLQYKEGDIIVYFSTIYGACGKTIASLIETTPLQARKVEYQFPIAHEELVRRFLDVVRKAKSEGLNVKVAIFDVVVSQPGVRFPFEALVEKCREEGILSCIDGAHGIGHVPLDLGKLNPDFFVSNLHKWLYTPRGSAVFHVPVRNQHLIRTTLPTSHGFQPAEPLDGRAIPNPIPGTGEKTSFESLFEFVATTDDTPYLCVPAALKFREKICGGEEKIMAYCEKLAHDAGNAVAEALGTEVMCEPGVDPKIFGGSQLRRCAFANVRVPLAVDDGSGKHKKNTADYAVVTTEEAPTACRWIERELMYTYKTVIPHFVHGDWVWARLSAQTYLELDDFMWAAPILKGLCNEVRLVESISSLKV